MVIAPEKIKEIETSEKEVVKNNFIIENSEIDEEKVIIFLSKYPKVAWTWEIWKKFWKKYKIDPIFAISIANADSSLGKHLKTKNNIWNVWNNDRWDRVEFATIEEWIEAIFRVLNNKYLGNIEIIWDLSWWWRKITWRAWCKVKWEYCYATSPYEWNKNVLATMSFLYWKKINEYYKFRK